MVGAMDLATHNLMGNLNKGVMTGFAAVLIAGTGSALAQQAPAPRTLPQKPAAVAPAPGPALQPPSSDEPQRTTATYGDWVVQCVTNANPPAVEVCDMAQVTQLQGKNIPFPRVGVAHPDKGQPVKLIVQSRSTRRSRTTCPFRPAMTIQELSRRSLTARRTAVSRNSPSRTIC